MVVKERVGVKAELGSQGEGRGDGRVELDVASD